MKALIMLTAAVLSLTGICLQFAIENDHGVPLAQVGEIKKVLPPKPADATKNKSADKSKAATSKQPASDQPAKAAPKTGADANKTPSDDTPEAADNDSRLKSRVPEKYAADEKAIRELHATLVKAYSSDDAKQVAANFSEDAEYINAQGTVFQGRDQIEQSLVAFLKDHPGRNLESEIEIIRFVSPTVALADGLCTVKQDDEHEPIHCRFDAVYAKTDGKWQIASIHDQRVFPFPTHEEQLAQLDFLLGDWVDEDASSIVHFTCRRTDNGKFLLREFSLKLQGQEAMTGSQRIGWDPLSGQLRTWIFDSEGGFADGVWQQDGENWVMHATGVTADGEPASGTFVYKIQDEHVLTWQAVDHEVGGVRIPDSPVFKLTHRAPPPGESDEAKDKNLSDKKPEDVKTDDADSKQATPKDTKETDSKDKTDTNSKSSGAKRTNSKDASSPDANPKQ